MKDLKLKLLPLNTTVNYKTANGIVQCLGRVKCRVTIGFKIMNVQLYVLKALLHPFFLGLDLIAAFSLEISPSLQIFQHLNVNRIERREEILPSKTYQENYKENLPIYTLYRHQLPHSTSLRLTNYFNNTHLYSLLTNIMLDLSPRVNATLN